MIFLLYSLPSSQRIDSRMKLRDPVFQVFWECKWDGNKIRLDHLIFSCLANARGITVAHLILRDSENSSRYITFSKLEFLLAWRQYRIDGNTARRFRSFCSSGVWFWKLVLSCAHLVSNITGNSTLSPRTSARTNNHGSRMCSPSNQQ